MPLNDPEAVSALMKLSDELEKMSKDGKTIAEVKKYDAEETVKIWRAYITSGDVKTIVAGSSASGGPVTGTGSGKIT